MPRIRELPDDWVGRLHLLLADPVRHAILRELLRMERATPGALADRLRPRFDVGRSAFSNHITQLRGGDLVRRERGGTLILADPHGLQMIFVQTHSYLRTWAAATLRDLDARLTTLQDATPPDWDADRANLSSDEAPGPIPTVPTPFSAGYIQRDVTLNRARRINHGPAAEILWVRAGHRRSQRIKLSQPAQYFPAPARLAVLNADWPPLVKLVDGCRSDERPPEDIFEMLQGFVEWHTTQILADIAPDAISVSALNDALCNRIRARLPRIETELRDTIAFRSTGAR